MYRALVLLDSDNVHQPGLGLTTFEAEFPRIVLAEVVTHRTGTIQDGTAFSLEFADRTKPPDLSKNSASSRAIPLWKMVKKIVDDPYIPERFSIAGPGMQAAGYFTGREHDEQVCRWLEARDAAIVCALKFMNTADRREVFEKALLGTDLAATVGKCLAQWPAPDRSLHKQDVNRLLEPFGWITQVITADSFALANFFALRCHSAAHPAFQRIARMMYLCKRASVPTALAFGEWHLPFIDTPGQVRFHYRPPMPGTSLYGEELPDEIQMSAARCAWVSYENHNREATVAAHKATFGRLLAEIPKHASPVEHQATPLDADLERMCPAARSNLRGWYQARKLIPMEKLDTFDPSAKELETWGDVGEVTLGPLGPMIVGSKK